MSLIRRHRAGRPVLGKRLAFIRQRHGDIVTFFIARAYLGAAATGPSGLDQIGALLRRHQKRGAGLHVPGVAWLDDLMTSRSHETHDRYLPWLADSFVREVVPVLLVERPGQLLNVPTIRWTHEHITRIFDWVDAENITLSKRITYEAAHVAARTWHERLAENRRLEAAAILNAGAVILHRWDDGWTLQHLKTRPLLAEEGEIMGHCVGSAAMYWDRIQRGAGQIWSLRDAKNVPHVTIELRGWFGVPGGFEDGAFQNVKIAQIQGTANTTPKREYLLRLLDALAFKPVDLNYMLSDLKKLRDKARAMLKGGHADVSTWCRSGWRVSRKRNKVLVAYTARYDESIGVMGGFAGLSSNMANDTGVMVGRLLQDWGWGEAHWTDTDDHWGGEYEDMEDEDEEEERDDGMAAYMSQRAAQAAMREWLFEGSGHVRFPDREALEFHRILPAPEDGTEAGWMVWLQKLPYSFHPEKQMWARLRGLNVALYNWDRQRAQRRQSLAVLHSTSTALRERARELLKKVYMQ